jgi:probable HAF family extracellular repeat protein
MKFRTQMRMTAVCLCTALAMTVGMAAQAGPSQSHKPKHHQYKLIDLGTLGGPNSQVNGGPPAMINNAGMVAGIADTSGLCPYFAFSISPAFKWQNGALIDMGLLPGGCFSLPNAINSQGMMVGSGDIGVIDPQTGLPEIRADVRRNGQIIDLGTFGAGNSLAGDVNDRGQVDGVAQNAIPDPFNFQDIIGFSLAPTQCHAFLWQDGVMRDLGTLGGTDSAAGGLNESGELTGISFTNSVVNPATGFPTLDPFLWTNGKMLDLGTLGGTFGGGNTVNNRGQVVGSSDVADDVASHAFFWDRGVMTDIGTLGGDNSSANWINDAGQVVGSANLADGTHHAFIWRKGTKTDLGTVGSDPCSNGLFINASGQVVGTSTDCQGTILHAFLWDNGSMIDLSAQILPGSGFAFVEPVVINDRGEIVGNGVLPNGDTHAVVLKSDGDHAGTVGTRATASIPVSDAARQNSVTWLRELPAHTPLERFRSQMLLRYHLPGPMSRLRK